jgi:glycerol kinase
MAQLASPIRIPIPAVFFYNWSAAPHPTPGGRHVDAILAIDQSTSATKALLFDPLGQLIDQASEEHRQIYPRPGWVEHDPQEIYANMLQAVRTVLERNPDCRENLLFLSITNQRETILVFEQGSGRPLHNAIVWQCRRGAALCEALVQAGHSDFIHQRTGLKIDTYFSASKIHWLVENDPLLAGKMERGEALLGTIDSYLIYRLTGGQVHATDSTNASRTLLYDINRLDWDDDLCRLFNAPRRALPQVRESRASYGETTLDGLLTRPIPIMGVMGDSQASLFAQRCFEPGAAKVTFGTGSSLLLNLGSQVRLSQNGIVTTVAWVDQGRPTYAFEGLINFSAATISWLKNQLQLISSAAETEAIALSVEDNGGVYLIPAFVGLSAPYWQPDARAAIIGMTPFTTRSHIVRAALESIAYQVKDALDLMVTEAGVPLQYINADGGAVRNGFLMQFVTDMIGYPVRIPAVAELSALGAVYCGMLGKGLVSTLEELNSLPRDFRQLTPQMDQQQVQALHAGWTAAVRRVL